MDIDYYRNLRTRALLSKAREQGIDPDMAIAMAERLELAPDEGWDYTPAYATMGGRYTFKNRSEA